jgi:hypothetical protein
VALVSVFPLCIVGCDGTPIEQPLACADEELRFIDSAPASSFEPRCIGDLCEDPARGRVIDWFVRRSGTVFDDFRHLGPSGIAVEDVNDDGLVDIATAAPFGIYLNRGGFEFEQVVLPEAMARTALTLSFGDFDGDGDLDLVTSGMEGTEVFENDGPEPTWPRRFRGIAHPRGANHILVADFDGDGWLDLHLGMPIQLSRFDPIKENFVYRNRGAFDFEVLGPESGAIFEAITWAASIIDFDHDGDIDIHVANDTLTADFGFKTETPPDVSDLPSLMLRNDGDEPMRFVDVGASVGVAGPY